MDSKIHIDNEEENENIPDIYHILQWCEKEQITIPEQRKIQPSSQFILPYHFLGETYTNISMLVTALAMHWEEGKQQLFQGNLSSHFKTGNLNYFTVCMNAEQAGMTTEKTDNLFWELLYQLSGGTEDFYWKGMVYSGLMDLGNDMLYNLRNEDFSKETFYAGMIEEKVISAYIKMIFPKEEKLHLGIQNFEKLQKNISDFNRERLRYYYQLAYFLYGKRSFYFNQQYFESLEEFNHYLKDEMEESYEELQDICHKIIDKKGKLDVQFESWLIALGKWSKIKSWKKQMNSDKF